MYQASVRRSRRRRSIIIAVAVLVIARGAAAGSYLLLRTTGSPGQTAASYLSAWQRGSYRAMEKVSVNVPRSGLAGPLQQASAELGVRRLRLSLGRVTTAGGDAQARFTATAALASGHTWRYQGRLRLVERNRRWWVSWSPAAIYPGLRSGDRVVLRAAWPPRAQVLAADGTVLRSPAAVAKSWPISLLTGEVVAATAAQAKKLGPMY